MMPGPCESRRAEAIRPRAKGRGFPALTHQEEHMSGPTRGTHDLVLRRHPCHPVLAGVFAALCLVSSIPALADHDSDDLLKTIKKARLIDLSQDWENASPVASVNPPYSFALSATHANTRGTFKGGDQQSRRHWRERRRGQPLDRQIPRGSAGEPRHPARCRAHGPGRLDPAAGDLRDHRGAPGGGGEAPARDAEKRRHGP